MANIFRFVGYRVFAETLKSSVVIRKDSWVLYAKEEAYHVPKHFTYKHRHKTIKQGVGGFCLLAIVCQP
jgi:hypothetical protein